MIMWRLRNTISTGFFFSFWSWEEQSLHTPYLSLIWLKMVLLYQAYICVKL